MEAKTSFGVFKLNVFDAMKARNGSYTYDSITGYMHHSAFFRTTEKQQDAFARMVLGQDVSDVKKRTVKGLLANGWITEKAAS